MKIRTLKLREAHKPTSSGGGPSYCSVLWNQQAYHVVTASSSDPTIAIHDSLILSSPPKLLRHHRDSVTALALSPNSTCLTSGSVNHSVKLYKFPVPISQPMGKTKGEGKKGEGIQPFFQ
ncbi:hypothetical protein ACFX2J_031728 [Malus domestica]